MESEIYQGVKFSHNRLQRLFSHDGRLERLNYWAYLFSQLGLAPVHSGGAYGNSSYRVDGDSFIITRSGMLPCRELVPGNFCRIMDIEAGTNRISYHGESPPSSECLLHHLIYRNKPGIQAILHGHSALLNEYCDSLRIPVTEKFHPYGTPELAASALEAVRSTPGDTFMFILRDHGFVVVSDSIDKAGRLTLDYFSGVIDIIGKGPLRGEP
jgi:ribulose-5-phosphate 4-epimerase/fuculose-1-phosphate aldolase